MGAFPTQLQTAIRFDLLDDGYGQMRGGSKDCLKTISARAGAGGGQDDDE